MMDDELNILPISTHVRDIQAVGAESGPPAESTDLADLKHSLADTEPAGPLIGCCKTLDQAKAGRCRFTLSKSVLKAPMVTALEAEIRKTAFKLSLNPKL
jgi:hypothetical protein